MHEKIRATFSVGNILTAVVLAALCCGVVAYKFYQFGKIPTIDISEPEAFFWTEGAFHFRHFMMVVEGEGIPALDREIQYPEGLDTARYVTPLMDRVWGTIYRVGFSSTPPQVFLIWVSFIFSTVSVLAVFGAARVCWDSKAAAVACAVVYGITPASFMRVAGGGLIREAFALPVLLLGFACFLWCLRRDRPVVAALGSVLFLVALASWHVTQLFLSLFWVGMVVVYFAMGGRGLPRKSLGVFVLFLAAGAVVLPVLRAKYFICSPPLMLGYGLLLALWLAARTPDANRARLLRGGLVIVGFFAASLVIQHLIGTYSHVYELIAAKIRYLGALPADPNRLSFEARVMWTSSFVSPSWLEVIGMLAVSLLFGAVGVAVIIYRTIWRQAGQHEVLVAYFVLGTFVLGLMMHRMSIFVVFFLSVAVGVLFVERRQFKYAAYIGLSVCLLIQAYYMRLFSLHYFRLPQQYVKSVTSFIRENTDPDAPVLSTFQLGPAIAAYGARPVILHSKFESKLIRDKVEAVYTALYRSEAEFFEVCRRYGARVFVYDALMAMGTVPGSYRYIAGATALRTTSAAYKFHFAPDQLEYFRLIHQTGRDRIFVVDEPGAEPQTGIAYHPIYDVRVFWTADPPDQVVPDVELKRGFASLSRPDTHRRAADRLYGSGRYEDAARQYRRVLRMDERNVRAAWGLGRTLVRLGDEETAAQAIGLAVQLDPAFDIGALDIPSPRILVELGRYEFEQKRAARAEAIFRKALDLDPRHGPACFALGMALFRAEKVGDAQAMFEKAVAYDPENHLAHKNLGKVYAIQKDIEKAVECVRRSLEIKPDQPHLQVILKKLAGNVEPGSEAAKE